MPSARPRRAPVPSYLRASAIPPINASGGIITKRSSPVRSCAASLPVSIVSVAEAATGSVGPALQAARNAQIDKIAAMRSLQLFETDRDPVGHSR